MVESDHGRAAPGGASTVFVVDGDPITRMVVACAAAAASLPAEACASRAEALAAIRPERPGCLVLDIRLPDADAFALLAALRARAVVLPAIVLAAAPDVATAVRALRAGVFDFFEKPVGEAVLSERLRAAVALDAQRRRGASRLREFAGRIGRLTQREREVMDLVIAGHSSRDIAAALALSPKTVETHRAKLMAKTGAASLAELIRLGLLIGPERGLLAVDPAAAYGTAPQEGSRR